MNISNIEIDDIDGIDRKDHPDYVDSYICAAHWKHSGNALTDDELDKLNDEHPEIAQGMAFEFSI